MRQHIDIHRAVMDNLSYECLTRLVVSNQGVREALRREAREAEADPFGRTERALRFRAMAEMLCMERRAGRVCDHPTHCIPMFATFAIEHAVSRNELRWRSEVLAADRWPRTQGSADLP